MNQLGFDVRFPSGPTQDEFASKWNNVKYFYLDEDPIEANTTPVDENDNNRAAERGEGEDEILKQP